MLDIAHRKGNIMFNPVIRVLEVVKTTRLARLSILTFDISLTFDTLASIYRKDECK